MGTPVLLSTDPAVLLSTELARTGGTTAQHPCSAHYLTHCPTPWPSTLPNATATHRVMRLAAFAKGADTVDCGCMTVLQQPLLTGHAVLCRLSVCCQLYYPLWIHSY
jgi:hypothetical protein